MFNLPDQPDSQKPCNNPFLEKAVLGLWLAREALADFLEFHQEEEGGGSDFEEASMPAYPCAGCCCQLCDHIRGVIFLLRTSENLLESEMGNLRPKLLQLRAAGFPTPDALADLVLSFHDADPDPDSPEGV